MQRCIVTGPAGLSTVNGVLPVSPLIVEIQPDTARAVPALACGAAVRIPDFVTGGVFRLRGIAKNQDLIAADPAMTIG